ncbi:hypothetical protein FA13DRAFT_1602778, partial [Coprinellus micaceus]
PFPNHSSFELGEWYIEAGSQLSLASLQNLVELAQRPGFSEQVSQANWPKIFNSLGGDGDVLSDPTGDANGDWIDEAGWKQTPVSIPVPIGGLAEARVVGTLFHRSIVSILREKISNSPDAELFHFDPFEVHWQPDLESPPQRVYSELYNSDAFMKAHRELQDSPQPAGCHLPRVVVGLMFWSDGTHVSAFSSEKLWPLYMCFGNESKYRRCKTASELCHHVAYFDELSADFKDYIARRNKGKMPADPFMAHCRMEMFHAQWHILQDDELLDAMENGVVIMCQDGKERRFYIRIFTYSADYPEKVLIATIKQRGDCPCPRCLVKKTELDQLGTPEDMLRREQTMRRDNEVRRVTVSKAREKIMPSDGKGVVVGNRDVQALLQPQSLQAVMNSFSVRTAAADPQFDIFSAVVIDQMHEFELGVWKELFLHLMRILAASVTGEALVNEFDRRFRLVPIFGRGIRRFSTNVSQIKRKAARDYEDLLQCCMPVFEALLPNTGYGQAMISLIAICARWHALAKLRMHTDDTLQMLEEATTELGSQFRSFVRDVCEHIATRELPAEAAEREEREKRQAEKKAAAVSEKATKKARKTVKMNISRVKFHFLGDYVKTIRRFGTTDLYSTELGELMHRSPKRWYRRSSKRNPRKEVVRHERRVARIRKLRNELRSRNKVDPKIVEEQKLGAKAADIHHFIGTNQNTPVSLNSFRVPSPDCSTFVPNLQKHLLPRVVPHTERQHLERVTAEGLEFIRPELGPVQLDWSSVYPKGWRIFSHKIIRIKYTTYDVRRREDVIHIGSDVCNVMIANPAYADDQTLPPYRYARVLGIYHADVSYTGEVFPGVRCLQPTRLEFVWVRWYIINQPKDDMVPLESVSFPPVDSPESTAFLHPNTILRAAHLIPRFHKGRVYEDGQGRSHMARDAYDWNEYYVNQFVDRDMFMRYQMGMAVGH